MYERELLALHKSNRFRERVCYDENLIDLASNDYLGFAEDYSLFKAAVEEVGKFRFHAPKASQLINGYHPIHKAFEEYLCKINKFESAIVAGSGFLANLSLIEALVRKKDILILDEHYHASGVMASKLLDAKVFYFKHNDADDLQNILKSEKYDRAIVAVEGIYSMNGDLLDKDIFDVTAKEDTLLIVDEAHSGGVIGETLLGIFEHYGIKPQNNHIKMGTLGKAMGSYGAYILASEEIILFLQNRAKALVYATAPSVFDIALSHESLKKSQRSSNMLKEAILQRKNLANEIFGKKVESPILKLCVRSSSDALKLKSLALDEGYLIGAIRAPTVSVPMLRIILRVGVPLDKMRYIFEKLKSSYVFS